MNDLNDKISNEAESQPSCLGAVMPRCSSCKFWNTDREEFKKSNLGWGYCTNRSIRTPMHDTEWKNNNELNSNRNTIISSDFKGFLTEENRQKGIVGIFQTGENFGCVHHNEA